MRTGKEVRRNGCGAKKNRQEGLVSTPGRERLAGLLVLKMVVRLLLCRNRVVRCWRRSADGDRSVGRGQKLLLLLLLLLQLQLQLLLLLLVLVLLLLQLQLQLLLLLLLLRRRRRRRRFAELDGRAQHGGGPRRGAPQRDRASRRRSGRPPGPETVGRPASHAAGASPDEPRNQFLGNPGESRSVTAARKRERERQERTTSSTGGPARTSCPVLRAGNGCAPSSGFRTGARGWPPACLRA